jgi:hypothetical protein
MTDNAEGRKMLEMLMTKLEKIDDRVGELNDKLDAKMTVLNDKLDSGLIDAKKEIHALQIDNTRRQVLCENHQGDTRRTDKAVSALEQRISDLESRVDDLETSIDKSDWKVTMRTIAKFATFVTVITGAILAVYQFIAK